ncbi:hypothetical protein Tco_0269161 [Tanacetum coccineum]
MAEVPYTAEYNVFVVETQHTEQHENMNDTSLMENVDSNTTPNSSDMCNNEFQADHNVDDNEDERQLKKANASLTHELNESKYALEESNDIRDRCKSALHDENIKLEKYKKYTNCQLEKEEGERKLKETLGLLAQQKHDLNEALKTQAYETFQVKEKKILYEKDDLANIFSPNCEETLILEEDSRSKLDKEKIKKALKQEIFEDLEYVQLLEKEVDELESKKAEFPNEYDLLLQECVLKDIMCAILSSFDNIDGQTELQCLYLEKKLKNAKILKLNF